MSTTRYSIGTVARDGRAIAVLSIGERLYDLAPMAPALLGDDGSGRRGSFGVLSVLEAGEPGSAALDELADRVAAGVGSDHVVEAHDGWLPPILQPHKVIGVGANYKDHLDYAGIPHPTTPYLFLKPASTTLLGHERVLTIPRQVEYADWEGELAAIVGRRARNVTPETALEHVFGYAPANDFSARDWLANAIPPLGSDWLLHKGWDGFTPIGPLITPAQFVDDPQQLRIHLSIDGETKQDGNTRNMVFGVADLIAHASTIMTLEPGDVVLTGTPLGSGMAVNPPQRLTPGQTMVLEVEGLGTLTTPTEAER